MEFEQNNDDEGGEFQNIENMLDDLGLGDDNTQTQYATKDSTVFVVDCSREIYNKQEGETEPQLKTIFDSYSNFLQKKIIGNTGDKVGLVLYNVKNQSSSNFKSVFVMHKLDIPSAKAIKQANDLYKNFDEITGGLSEEKSELQDVFWAYNDEIKGFTDNKYYLRLFLFTAEDCPHQPGSESSNQAIGQSVLLAKKGVQIQLFPLKKSKSSIFDVRKFYQQIITFDQDEINPAGLDTTSKILDLKERLRQKQFKKRTLNRLLMKVGNETQIGVKIYALYTKAKKPTPKKLDASTNKILKRVTKKLNRKGEVLFDAQIGTYYPLGGEKIKITKQEMNKIKSIEPPGMTLVGFKPKKLIKPYHNIRTSYFIYPDEEHVTGSSQFCDALIDELVEKNLVGIVKLVPRNNQEMVFAALFPQKQNYDEIDHYQTPPGFNMIILPYADDIVNFVGDATVAKPVEISKELLQVTNLLVENLTIQDFDFRNFENPSLQKFYSHLQTLALGEERPIQRPDLLLPDTEGMQNYSDIINMLIETVEIEKQHFTNCQKKEEVIQQQEVQAKKQEFMEDQDVYVVEKKSKVKQSKRGPKKKVKKQIEIQSDEQQYTEQKKKFSSSQQTLANEVQSMILNGQTDSVKAADLKKYLSFYGIDPKGKREQLLNKALIYITERPTI